MARARNIKPGVFKNELLVERSFAVRLLFIGLWTLADREGRVENRPKRIKLELFPYDDVDVVALLEELQADGFIRLYESGGKRVIVIDKFIKHQTPHGTEKDSELPDEHGFYTVNERTEKGYVTGRKRSNAGGQRNDNVNLTLSERALNVAPPAVNVLNPDVLNPDVLNPDVLNPDVLNPESNPVSAGEKKSAKEKTFTSADALAPDKAETALQAACRETWKCYAGAFWERYHTEPVVNAKVRSLIKQFVQRLPYAEAPLVAAYFVANQSAYYVRKGHDVGSLLADAEKLRTEWATNRQVTDAEARQSDRTQSNANAAGEAMRILEAQGLA